VIMTLLFVAELKDFLKIEVQPELKVDTERDVKMEIYLDIVYPAMPCSYMHIDVLDVLGGQQLDIAHNMFKTRLDLYGVEIDTQKHEILGEDSTADKAASALAVLVEDRCESCYGAESEDLKCCNNCEEVRAAYKTKGWAFSTGEGIIQCEREGWSEEIKLTNEEGCNIHGKLTVNKVAGNFHIAPGKNMQQYSVHIHDLHGFGRRTFNMSHSIRKLAFGVGYPGQTNPLDNHVAISTEEEGSVMYQYFIKVVPTKYGKLDGDEIVSSQYSVSTHKRKITQSSGLPGTFYMFEMSPMQVSLTETRHSLPHFLTSVCAIIGGIFTVAGIVDGMIYHGLRSMEAKEELGKLG